MLLRHAKSDWSTAGLADHDRTLAARGRQSAPLIGNYMVRHRLVPDVALVSTALRARETWDLVAQALGADVPVSYEPRLYDASADRLRAVIRERSGKVGALLVLAHNPGLHDLARYLIASGDTDSRTRLAEKFPTGALAVIDFPLDAWDHVHEHGGRLARFVTPRSLTARTD
jgi:phosphohistidine phosphatase